MTIENDNTIKLPDLERSSLDADGFKVLDEDLLPPVNEVKRFFKVFLRRRIVVISTVIFLVLLFAAVFANLIAPYDANAQDLYNTLAKPNLDHLLGTDNMGRDLLSRLIYGARIAFVVGILTSIISGVAGTIIGMVAAVVGGIVQDIIMRITDAMMSIPSLIFSMLIIGALHGGMLAVIIAVAVAMLPGFIRIINGQVLSVKENDYIMAEYAMGASLGRILFKHVFPNITSLLIVQVTMAMGGAIMAEAALSFLGIGIAPPTPAWGAMCFDGYQYMTTVPLLAFAPGLLIMLLVFSLNMIGDGLRDALDPRLRGTAD